MKFCQKPVDDLFMDLIKLKMNRHLDGQQWNEMQSNEVKCTKVDWEKRTKKDAVMALSWLSDSVKFFLRQTTADKCRSTLVQDCKGKERTINHLFMIFSNAHVAWCPIPLKIQPLTYLSTLNMSARWEIISNQLSWIWWPNVFSYSVGNSVRKRVFSSCLSNNWWTLNRRKPWLATWLAHTNDPKIVRKSSE